MPPMEAKAVHVSINRDWGAVYAFAAKPENMTRWASGLGSGLIRDGADWLPMGAARHGAGAFCADE